MFHGFHAVTLQCSLGSSHVPGVFQLRYIAALEVPMFQGFQLRYSVALEVSMYQGFQCQCWVYESQVKVIISTPESLLDHAGHYLYYL